MEDRLNRMWELWDLEDYKRHFIAASVGASLGFGVLLWSSSINEPVTRLPEDGDVLVGFKNHGKWPAIVQIVWMQQDVAHSLVNVKVQPGDKALAMHTGALVKIALRQDDLRIECDQENVEAILACLPPEDRFRFATGDKFLPRPSSECPLMAMERRIINACYAALPSP